MAVPIHTAAQLRTSVTEMLPLFERADDASTLRRARPDSWCAREILGHLIDSACNNHRRFIVGQSRDTSRLDGYEQNAWVSRQRYADVPWRELVSLWSAYNLHLAHVMTCVDETTIDRELAGPDGSPVTLRFIIDDYVVHLRHHLEQIRRLLDQ